MDYLTVTQAAEKWGVSTRRVRALCANGEIDGVIRKGKLYMIPAGAENDRMAVLITVCRLQ